MPQIGRHFMPNMQRAAWGFMQSGDFPQPVWQLKFGENSGAEAKDSSPNGYDGAIEGATWVKGYLGPALSFDGLDDRVDITPPTTWGEATTLFARIKCAKDAVDQYIFRNTSWFTSMNKYSNNTLYGGFKIDGSIKTGAILSGSWTSDAWTDVAFTVKATTSGGDGIIRGYINGIWVRDTAGGAGDLEVTLPHYIGCNDIGVSHYTGLIDEIRMYDVELTAAQLREISLGYR